MINNKPNKYDVIAIGAGAAGLMAASVAAKRGRKVLLLESTGKIGEKIRISGGGRCNFTNLDVSAKNYLSDNPYFAISPLARYSSHDFIKLVESYNIAYHQKTLGQLFCDGSSRQIVEMLVDQCQQGGVEILLSCNVEEIAKPEEFELKTNLGQFRSASLIIASGGLSIPKMGASDFGYRIAQQFGVNIIPTRPALVPLTATGDILDFCNKLSGVAVPAIVLFDQTSFRENILFTHRGLSGPAILQISSYIKDPSNAIVKIDLLPGVNLYDKLTAEKTGKAGLVSVLKEYLPKRLVDNFNLPDDKKMADYKNLELKALAELIHAYPIKIDGTEGYAKAEVTAGGVDTNALTQNMEVRNIRGLYFIGEVVDVTGWLGGYNFQWAWSSGHAAGSAV